MSRVEWSGAERMRYAGFGKWIWTYHRVAVNDLHFPHVHVTRHAQKPSFR